MFYKPDSKEFMATERQFRNAFPNTSFSELISAEAMAEFGVYELADHPKPDHDSNLQRLEKSEFPTEIGKTWGYEFSIVNLDASEIDQRLQNKKGEMLSGLNNIAKTNRNAGVTVNGLHIATDADGRSLLFGAKQGGKPIRKTVTKTGRAILTKIEVDARAIAADDYLQLISDNQYDLEEAIEAAADQTALDAIDINAGWPS